MSRAVFELFLKLKSKPAMFPCSCLAKTNAICAVNTHHAMLLKTYIISTGSGKSMGKEIYPFPSQTKVLGLDKQKVFLAPAFKASALYSKTKLQYIIIPFSTWHLKTPSVLYGTR